MKKMNKNLKKGMITLATVAALTGGGLALANENSWGGEDYLDTIYKTIDEFDSTLTLRQQELTSVKNDSEQTKEELASVKNDSEQTKQELEQKKIEANQYKLELERSTQVIAEKSLQISALNETIKDLNHKLENVSNSEEDNKQLRALLEEKVAKISKLTDELKYVSEEHGKALTDANEKVMAISEEYQELATEYDNLDATYRKTTDEVSKLKNENKDLQQQLKDKETTTQKKLDAALNDAEMLSNYATQKLENNK